ncbi:uncharacterized protein LOC133196672 [Saccostrea echinata]|uniref:uncharacterized protein LOC133196672 n=1 Tax=Saccostrea echinata TaxID=191078 RepID=UPI002A81F80D|nr:uncharacterized protein LOC133196672 [Saccostrea echinata]
MSTMELKDRSDSKDKTDGVKNTQAIRVIDHVLSLLCCGKGHSSLTNIKTLGDRLQHQGYLQKEKWEKKHSITKDKIILLNWIKEHLSPKTYQVKDALFDFVRDLRLLEDKDLLEVENFELNQAMNILFDIQQNAKREDVDSLSHLHEEIKRTYNSPQVSPKIYRKHGDSKSHKDNRTGSEVNKHVVSTPKDLITSPSSSSNSTLSSPLNDRKSKGKTPRDNKSIEAVQKQKKLHSPSSSPKLSRPGTTTSTVESERSYLNLHREKKTQKQQSEIENKNYTLNTPNRIQPRQPQSGKGTLKADSEKMKSVLYHLMLRPSEDKRKFCNIIDALSYDLRKKDMKNELIQFLHENPPKFSLKHIGFIDGGEWSLYLRTKCPDALFAYAVAHKYQVLLHVVAVGTEDTEELRFYPHGYVHGNEDRHVYLAYLSDNNFMPLAPMDAVDFPSHIMSSENFQKCLAKIENLEKENRMLRTKLQEVEDDKDEDFPTDHKVALSDHVSLRLRRNSNNLEIDKLRQQLHLIKIKIEQHKRI